ncbi:MAG: hypothetical protein M3069_17390 [Chloroflexota bacterium]|nr:hypothetical protein [Chloroflexota bacterium]
MTTRLRRGHIGIALVLCVSAAAYAGNLSNPFFGSDTWPWLVSTRIERPEDLLRVAFSPIMSGTNFVAEVAHFYHPLTALSYSLDQALFGLSPVAFYATNLLIHLVAVGGLYSLARGLGASWWASSACALMLGCHPVAAATVPSLPRRQDLVVGALLIGSMSLLARALNENIQPRWRWLGGAMVLFFLALGGKEIAYAGLAVVPFVLACSWPRRLPKQAEPARIRSMVALCVAGFVILEVVGFSLRWAVLSGLGGYNGSTSAMGTTQGLVEFYVRPYVTDVLWPFHSAMPDRLRDWLLVLAGIALVVGIATGGFERPPQLLVVTGIVWQAAFLGLYAVVHTSLSPYLMYVPLAGLALLVAALLDGTADRWQHPARVRRWARLTGACGVASAAGSALLLIGVVRTSALLTDYPEFRDAGSASTQFIDQAMACLASIPATAAVDVDSLPHRIDYGSSDSQFIDAYVFEAYSLESVVRLLAPAHRAPVEVRSVQDVNRRAPSVAVTCVQSGDRWQISARVGP